MNNDPKYSRRLIDVRVQDSDNMNPYNRTLRVLGTDEQVISHARGFIRRQYDGKGEVLRDTLRPER